MGPLDSVWFPKPAKSGRGTRKARPCGAGAGGARGAPVGEPSLRSSGDGREPRGGRRLGDAEREEESVSSSELATGRAAAEGKDAEEPQRQAPRGVAAGAGRGGRRGAPGGAGDRLAARPPPSRGARVTDSEWLDLSAEEQLAWAKNTQDPRIAVGSQSPLEKKIKFAKAEEYYYRRHQATTLGEAWRYTTAPRWEIKIERQRPQGDKTGDAKKWDYLVSERELDHIKKHIYRAERARGLRDHKYRLLPQRVPSDTVIPKIRSPGKEEKTAVVQKTHKTKTKKHRAAWAKEQIRGHQDRMIRGRELTEQRSESLCAWRVSAPAPPLHRSATHKEEEKEFERITAYPIAQPYQEALIKVTILTEKSRKEEHVKKPLRRELLSMPPFLRSQLEKKEV
ncbi:uncharacterized protein LOC101682771 [Mustela putorius furo]|uniref:Uncharacterized protein LOC101682771 n=1 Tax=Mustela putorius furo TaxID=9669 RepID=A0A8U0RLA8_MUSPF|nr:uncharacterized protein LOC101682771 [Mustela putorius furo]